VDDQAVAQELAPHSLAASDHRDPRVVGKGYLLLPVAIQSLAEGDAAAPTGAVIGPHA
jgi:hypothetical protein